MTGKTVAVIANGPSGNGQGPAIDGCDFVIRMKNWKTYGPVNAGQKTSAILGFNARWTDVPPEFGARRDWELWCPYPAIDVTLVDPSFKSPGVCVDWKWVLKIADGRIIRTLSIGAATDLTARIRALSPIPGVFTTAGSAAIAMAVERSPGQLHLWGFDRIDDSAGNPSNDWARVQLTPQMASKNTMHDFASEKKMIAELVDSKSWCGKPIDFPVFWHGRPQCK